MRTPKLTPTEELKHRELHFSMLEPRMMFKFHDKSTRSSRSFVVVQTKFQSKEILAIELTDENWKKLFNRQPCELITIRFDQMHCLNLL